MTLKFFYDNYKLDELDIIDIKINLDSISLIINLHSELELIANGYRPSMDMYTPYLFNLSLANKSNYYIDKPYYIKKYEFDDNFIYLEINNSIFLINNINDIKII